MFSFDAPAGRIYFEVEVLMWNERRVMREGDERQSGSLPDFE